MNINNIGYRTDCILRECDGTVIEKTDYFVIRMPSNPTFHWGNLLLFKRSPKEGDYGKWIEAHMKEFGPESGHVTFGWDVPSIGEIQVFTDNGFHLNEDSVLQLRELRKPRKPSVDIEIRKIVRGEEWQSVVELQILVSKGKKPSESFCEFINNLFRTYRMLSEKGHGNWWGAFSGKTLVGDLGLYFDKGFEAGRFQCVETHPEYRRKGICSLLLHAVVKQSIESTGVSNLFICTEKESAAWKAYKTVGFEHTTFQYGVSLPCTYEKRFEQCDSQN